MPTMGNVDLLEGRDLAQQAGRPEHCVAGSVCANSHHLPKKGGKMMTRQQRTIRLLAPCVCVWLGCLGM